MSESDPNTKTDSGFIIEIGVLAYALLVKIDEFHAKYRQDRRYNKMLISVMPEEIRNDIPFSDSTMLQFTELIGDILKRTKRICKPYTLNFTKAENNSVDNAKVNKYMKFYADITSQIDILVDDDLVTYTFILLPYCRLSSKQQKEEFLQQLDRSSPQAKCESLMEDSQYLIKEMKIDYTLKNNTTEVGKILLKYQALWRTLFLWIIVITNGVILASYNENHGSRIDDPKLFDLSVKDTRAILLALGILCIAFWALTCLPKMISLVWMTSYRYDLENDRKDILKTLLIRGKDKTNSIVSYHSIANFCLKLSKIFTNAMLIYFLMLIASIIMGIIWHPFFYCFMVSFIIVQSPQMNNLLKAIWEPKFAIIGTIILMFLVNYFFVMVSYNSFPSDYPDGDCYSLWTCFISSMDHTLKNSGIGNYLNSSYTVKSDKLEMDYERLIFDNLEYLLITLLLIAIISGIIIDKFGELRDRREQNETDAKSSCFICGRESKDINRDLSLPDFDTHVKLQHNLWDYVYFIAYLRYQEEHNPGGFSAIEKHVITKMNKNDPSWFPSFKQ